MVWKNHYRFVKNVGVDESFVAQNMIDVVEELARNRNSTTNCVWRVWDGVWHVTIHPNGWEDWVIFEDATEWWNLSERQKRKLKEHMMHEFFKVFVIQII